jgi:hypothetical protein
LNSFAAAEAIPKFQLKSSSLMKYGLIDFKYTNTSSNYFKIKKHCDMHCLPGIVSHSEGDAPTIWKKF